MTTSKRRVLFVCLGNICRSPAAESVFIALLDKRGVREQFVVESAGTGGWHTGEPPDARMRRHGEKRGLKFESLARQFVRQDFTRFDHIVVMDDSNYQDLCQLAVSEDECKKVLKMAAFQTTGSFDKVPDPYYGGPDGFELVLDILEDACSGLMEHLQEIQ